MPSGCDRAATGFWHDGSATGQVSTSSRPYVGEMIDIRMAGAEILADVHSAGKDLDERVFREQMEMLGQLYAGFRQAPVMVKLTLTGLPAS